MSDFNIDLNNINLKTITKKGEMIKKISLQDQQLQSLIQSITKLFESLRENKCDWKANDNFLLMDVVHYGLIFTRKLKKMPSEKKKKLILSLLLNILENEVKKSDELLEIKEKIIDGIEIVVEPALELAMMTQNNEFKIPRNFILSIFKICRPKN